MGDIVWWWEWSRKLNKIILNTSSASPLNSIIVYTSFWPCPHPGWVHGTPTWTDVLLAHSMSCRVLLSYKQAIVLDLSYNVCYFVSGECASTEECIVLSSTYMLSVNMVIYHNPKRSAWQIGGLKLSEKKKSDNMRDSQLENGTFDFDLIVIFLILFVII